MAKKFPQVFSLFSEKLIVYLMINPFPKVCVNTGISGLLLFQPALTYFSTVSIFFMQRRAFLTNTILSAVAVSASGFIRFTGDHFIGECETTTDILGPFYRPNSPVRKNLMISGEKGSPVVLSGYIRHADCTTPYKNAKIELWHCDQKGVYDNQSSEFRYRGTSFTDDKGYYSFQTIFPVPYEAEPGIIRPAHFHLMITAAGYQPLVTQLYFNGDAHIREDAYASSPKAKKRILDVQKSNTGVTNVLYDVAMSEILHLEAAALDKLVGSYISVTGKKKAIELFSFNNTLWMKNEAFGDKFEYAGNNIFEEAGNPSNRYWKLQFTIAEGGSVQIAESYIDDHLKKHAFVYQKNQLK